MAERSRGANVFIALFFGTLIIIGLGGAYLLWSGQMARNAETAAMDIDIPLPKTPNLPKPAPLPNPEPLPIPDPKTPG